MLAQEESLIFIHIPKAAGTTLDGIIRRHFPKNDIFSIDGTQRTLAEFKQFPEEKMQSIMCLTGHMPFGLHEYLPRRCIYITLIRNPVDRIISEYYYIKRNPGHFLYDKVTSNNMPLHDFCSNYAANILSNLQTGLISGRIELEVGISNREFSNDILEIAKKNICEYFTIAGVTERFDEMLILCKRFFGWRNIYYIKRNVTKDRPSTTDIPEETLRLIEAANELDIELYNFTKQKFSELINKQGYYFTVQLITFQFCNKVYQNIGAVIATLRRLRQVVQIIKAKVINNPLR